MYPPSNNNCNHSPILSSVFHNIPSPLTPYEYDLFFQSYHDYFLEHQQQVPFIEDQSLEILVDNTETVTDSVKIPYNTETVTSNYIQGNEGVEGRENKGDDMMSSRISIIRGRIQKNKRSSNKDRHSKINTARGPRDRRMRLSIDAARKFFDLQDLLGFDKASKTVGWLLNKAEAAVKELAKGNGGAVPHMNRQTCTSTTAGVGAICASNYVSECEVISGTFPDETSSNNNKKETAKGGPSCNKDKKKKAKMACRVAFDPLIRESRNQARARARERTQIKIGKSKANMSNWRPFKSATNVNDSPYEVVAEIQELTSHQEKQLNRADHSNLVVNENWNVPFTNFNYQQNAGITHEHQLTDFQFCAKLWET
ncbi:hypothetical protein K7X08_022452 [Anisodus acutangulus]|uniref:Uncharacterized protein n=1 Tax=Anisodus acutangulus TaxID=402998 RepID=A0A9Q1RJZ7_9SOLA|nr:hypothetical protein K7X08_022452 [Anisodus acutangulus]